MPKIEGPARIIYHRVDLDGYCSGAVAAHFCEANMIPFTMHPFTYGDDFPWGSIGPNDTVIMVDLAIQPYDGMITLANSCKKLIWIDHHKKAVDALENNQDPKWLQRGGLLSKRAPSACQLTWEYFFPNTTVPQFIQLLSLYDSYQEDHPDWETRILPFQYGMKMRTTDPNEDMTIWEYLIRTHGSSSEAYDLQQLMNVGSIVIEWNTWFDDEYLRLNGFETTLNGLRAIAVNRGMSNSRAFKNHYDPERHDIMISFVHVGKKHWTVSLYSNKPEIDCGQVAGLYGGGGHEGAGGFQIAELPFEWKVG
jgi:oligoribonuclease NrnB/cAMP/cGMP phosphodiesterase (DHH superfamily)